MLHLTIFCYCQVPDGYPQYGMLPGAGGTQIWAGQPQLQHRAEAAASLQPHQWERRERSPADAREASPSIRETGAVPQARVLEAQPVGEDSPAGVEHAQQEVGQARDAGPPSLDFRPDVRPLAQPDAAQDRAQQQRAELRQAQQDMQVCQGTLRVFDECILHVASIHPPSTYRERKGVGSSADTHLVKVIMF